MYFKRIEMHGFKSFADPVTIEFDKGITCIVGPNGSGKSNISDAIRWVLGEQSPKMLRGGKMEDVIFAGTSARKSRGMAEVTFVLDNSTGILPIEFKEVAITRRMYRSGESEYLINNTHCRMKDIRELLMDTGLGVDGYSLIGQGKISEIISNKTESIREVFEETAGIVSYRNKKTEAERKITSAKNNLDRVKDIISEIETRIDGLREDSKKAEEYLSLKGRYRVLEINLIINSLKDIENNLSETSEDITSIDRELLDIDKEKYGLEQEIAGLLIDKDNISKDIQELQEKVIESISYIKEIEKRQGIFESEKKGFENTKKRIEKDIISLNEQIENNKINIENLKDREFIIDEAIENCREILQSEDERLKEIEKNLNDIRQEESSEKDAYLEASQKLSKFNVEIIGYNNLLENLQKSRDDIKSQKAKSEETKVERKSRYEELSYNYQDEKLIKQDLEEKIQDLSKKVSEFEEKRDNLRNEIHDIKINLESRKSRIATISEMEANYEGYNHGVKTLLSMEMEGIRGVVADIIKVPEKLALAVETTLGAGLQNIICDNEEHAKRAVDFLKKSKSGRVTLLPISTIRTRDIQRDKKLSEAKGFISFGIDAVDFDVEFKKPMEYLLGNSVFFEDMDSAMEAYKNNKTSYKIVTLEGDVINSSGAVTGGSYKTKGISILSRKAELDKLTSMVDANEKKILEKEKYLQVIEGNYKKDTQDLKELRIELDAKKDNLLVMEQELGILANQLHEMENLDEGLNKRHTNIEEEENKIHKLLEELTAKRDVIQLEVETGEAKVDTLDLKRRNIEEEYYNINDNMRKASVALMEKEKDKESHLVTLDMYKNNIETIELQIEEKKLAIKELDEKIQDKSKEEENSKDYQNALTSKDECENILYQKRSEEKELLDTLNEKEVENKLIYQRRKDIAKKKYDIEIKCTRYRAQEENLKERLWEEFEVSYIEALEMIDDSISINKANKENRDIKNRLRDLGTVNIGAIEEYKAVSTRYEFLTKQKNDIETSMAELENIIKDMDNIIKNKFKDSFDKVVSNFQEIFREFFGGGYANITIDRLDNPLEGNLEITVQPPGKQLKNINLLSGGEKTMTAIALMFAVLKTKPTPCCILDEVEAALDDSNIEIFANYLRKFRDIQFTLITHQKATMEHADVLYGVTMPERGVSKVYSLKLDDDKLSSFVE